MLPIVPPINAQNPGSCAPGFMNYRHYVRRPDQQVFSVLTGASHDLASTLINYDFSVSRAHNIGGQDFATTRFNNGRISNPSIDIGLNTSDPYAPKFPVLDGTNVFDPTTYSISEVQLPHYHSTQLNFQGAASVARRYSVHEHYGTLQFGIKIRNAHKTQTQEDQIYGPANGTNFALSQVLGTFSNPNYYEKAYQYGPLSDYSKINNLISSNLGTGLVLDPNASLLQSLPADFDANERVYAGFVMNTIGFGKLSLQSGVRFEATDASYLAKQVAQDTSGNVLPATPINGSSSYVSILPSIQVQYRIQKDTNLRGIFGIGISRPNFADIVPSRQVDPNTTTPFPQIVVGNPALKPTKGNNYDILVEHYFQPLGILQAGFFYKTLSDPIYSTTTRFRPSNQQPFPVFDQIQSINGRSGHITGFEAAWEQRLSFLPGLLRGFGVAANYSYTTSQVTFPTGFNGGRTDHPRLQRQAPNNWNLGASYDRPRLSVRFAVSHNDASIYSYFWTQSGGLNPSDPVVGLPGPNGDQYLYAHTQYDIQGSYRLYRGLRFVAYGLNLSNEVFGFYQGSKIYPIQREFYQPTVSFGLRWTSTAE